LSIVDIYRALEQHNKYIIQHDEFLSAKKW